MRALFPQSARNVLIERKDSRGNLSLRPGLGLSVPVWVWAQAGSEAADITDSEAAPTFRREPLWHGRDRVMQLFATCSSCALSRRSWRGLIVALWLIAGSALAGISPPSSAREPLAEVGTPVLKNFSPEEYGGYPQNWAVVQDPRGIIYVANGNDGVLEFDGTRWRHIDLARQTTVRSLAVDAHGRVYVGSIGDFGYLAPDATGRLRFVSMRDQLATEDRDFTDVWNIFVGEEGIYFATADRLFQFAGGKVQVWKAQTEFHLAFYVNQKLYVQEIGRGLEVLQDGRLQLLAGGERYANDKIYVMVPWAEAGMTSSLLIGSRQAGWTLFDGHEYRTWQTQHADALKAANIYGAQWLAGDVLAVATLQSGVIMLDRQGNEVGRVGSEQDLIGDTVYAMAQDREGGLWLALDDGIARVEVGSALTRFTRASGLEGAVMSIHRHAGALYAGTATGLFRLDEHTKPARFERIAGIGGQVWSMTDMGRSLLVAGGLGVFKLDENDRLRQLSDEFSFALFRPWPQDNRLLIGTRAGVMSARLVRDRLVGVEKVPGLTSEVHAFLADADGTVWVGFEDEGVARLVIPANAASDAALRVEKLALPKSPQGSPGFSNVNLGLVDGSMRFGTPSGIQQLNATSTDLLPDDRFAELSATGLRQVWGFVQDAVGSMWLYSVDPVRHVSVVGVAVADAKGGYHWDARPLQGLSSKTMFRMWAEPDGVSWFGTNDGLYRYDAAKRRHHTNPAATLLRMVTTTSGRVIWGGAGHATKPVLPWGMNDLRFEYAQPGFEMGSADRYQVMLEGMNDTWSDWTDESYRDYTNLHEGTYRFRVRARDAYGNLSDEASFPFSVLPPWYRSWWVYVVWGGLLLLAIAGVTRWRVRALRGRNKALGRLVRERTAALEQANAALVDQTITDALTGLRNRRYVVEHVETDVATVQRNYRQLALGYADHADANINLLFLMMDLDHFKEVNDRHGHAAGDRVLAQLRDILTAATRESDTPVRWGGDEFLVVARFANNGFGPVVAERIRAMIENHPFDIGDGQTIRRTCSVGFASYPAFAGSLHTLSWEDVVNLADQCLYRAKSEGRNRWVGVVPTAKARSVFEPGDLPVDVDALVADGYLSVLSSTRAESEPLEIV